MNNAIENIKYLPEDVFMGFLYLIGIIYICYLVFKKIPTNNKKIELKEKRNDDNLERIANAPDDLNRKTE